MAAERDGWYRVERLIRSLTPAECLVPGYFHDPDWAVRDLAAHLGTWLAEAGIQLERMTRRHVRGPRRRHRDPERVIPGGHGRPAMGRGLDPGHVRPVEDAPWRWSTLTEPTDEAAWWIHKVGSEHYAEHIDRLEEWVAELLGRRGGTAG